MKIITYSPPPRVEQLRCHRRPRLDDRSAIGDEPEAIWSPNRRLGSTVATPRNLGTAWRPFGGWLACSCASVGAGLARYWAAPCVRFSRRRAFSEPA